MTVAQTALNAVMNLCPIILIVTLIAGLIAAGVALYKNWDKVGPYFKTAWDGITLPFRVGWGTVSAIWDNLCELPDVIKNEGFAGLPGWFGGMFDDVKQAVFGPMDELYNKIANLIPEGIKNAWKIQ